MVEQARTGTESLHSLSGLKAQEKLRQLLGHFRSAMLVTLSDGQSDSRPMGLTASARDFDGTLWFFSNDASFKVQDIAEGAVTMLIFQSDEAHAYLHLDGRAQIVRDRARMKALYTPLIRTWFPDGLDDPHLVLIRFDAERGRYWESPGGMLNVLTAFTKSVLTGRPGSGGEMGEVRLRPG